jgi:hypothetical protein
MEEADGENAAAELHWEAASASNSADVRKDGIVSTLGLLRIVDV